MMRTLLEPEPVRKSKLRITDVAKAVYTKHRRSVLRWPLISKLVPGLIFCCIVSADAENWPAWRGPTANDISTEESGWDGSNWIRGEAWSFEAGEGSSAPVVIGNRVFLTGWAADKDHLICLNADTGKEVWRQSYQSPKYGREAVGDQGLYSGACSTPSFDSRSGLLVTLSIDGLLAAWNTSRKGEQVWSRSLYDDYQAPRRPEVAKRKKTRRDYGYVCSPLIHNNEVIVEVGGKSGNLVAFDLNTGREVWTSENADEAGHTGGPVLMMVDGQQCVAVLTLRNLVVSEIPSNAGHAKTVASFPWTTDYGNNIATVAVDGQSVIITSAYNQFAVCRVDVDSRGAREVWRNTKLASGVCSPVISRGRVYWAWRGIHCVDFETGREQWNGGRIGSQGSCILTKDERLIVYGNKGDLLLCDARRDTDRYTELTRQAVLSRTDAWPHVVLSSGRLYCRDRRGTVKCLRVR